MATIHFVVILMSSVLPVERIKSEPCEFGVKHAPSPELMDAWAGPTPEAGWPPYIRNRLGRLNELFTGQPVDLDLLEATRVKAWYDYKLGRFYEQEDYVKITMDNVNDIDNETRRRTQKEVATGLARVENLRVHASARNLDGQFAHVEESVNQE